MDKAMKPAIRFARFTDAWEQRKLKDLCSTFTDGDWIESKDQSENGVRLLQTGNVGVTEFIDKPNNKKWVSEDTFDRLHCTEVSCGDILISRLPEPAGRACIVPNLGQKMITAVDCTIVKTALECDSKFLVQYLSSSAYFTEVNNCLAGGTRQRISRGNLSTFDVPISMDISEQKKIGEYFANLDNLITLHQRKYDKLQNVKKSMLEKVFPKDGADVPEIRFKGFTGAWEQHKVGDLIDDYIEKTIVQNQYPVLTSSQQQGIVFQEDYFADRQVTTDDNIGYFVLPRGYFTYRSRSDTNIFVFNRNDLIDKGIISYYYPVFRARDTDSNFFLRRINHGMYRQLVMAAEGTGQHVLAHTKFKNMITMVPSFQEQEQIGQLFEALDNLITFHQRELEKLQNLKKALLEKMFI